MYIDTHCHLSIEDYDDIDTVIKENRKEGISKIIISGCMKDSLDEAVEIGCKYDDVYVTLGFHPEGVLEVKDQDIEKLKDMVINNKKVVGIGEIGLDYYYDKEHKKEMIDLFEKQLKLAEELDLPVVIHSRDATQDTIDVLMKYKVRGVIHCFSGSCEVAKRYINMGYKLGIGGIVTFKNSNLYKVVEEVGLENIVLETDSPYLTPVPYRGKKNSSKYIPLIAKRVAEILNCKEEEVAEVTSNNAIMLFDLK